MIADDDIILQDSDGYKFTEPTEYTTDDLMITIVVVGKGWLKNELG